MPPIKNKPLFDLSLEAAIDRHPLVVSPETPLGSVIALMSRAICSCRLSNIASLAEVVQLAFLLKPLQGKLSVTI